MIGIVGPDGAADRLADAVRDRGESVVRGDAASVLAADPALAFAVGEPAVVALARAGVACPVLPVDAGPGVGSLSLAAAVDSLDHVLAGAYETVPHRRLAVSVGNDRVGRAFYDVMLVTEEPGRISEYAVAADAPLDRFRADGVVVASTAGSHGYASAAGGPILDATTDAVVVVPVAAFRLRSATRVVELPVTLTVERDEAAVALLLDDREHTGLDFAAPVTVQAADPVAVVALA